MGVSTHRVECNPTVCELAEFDAALERLRATPERCGICEDTGRPIPLERLEIIPWARTCQ